MTTQKQIVRKAMRNKLKHITSQERTMWSHAICTSILALNSYHQADIILGYIPTDYEPDITPVYQKALQANKQVAFPRCLPDGSLQFMLVDIHWQSHVATYTLPIYEPGPIYTEIVASSAKNLLMLVPAVAFTDQNIRLGHGKGYYDRYLADHPVSGNLVGVCFSLQISKSFPVEHHDRQVDMVITELGIF
jgi:5-formyltetrahydrofolate cyclo-ligase